MPVKYFPLPLYPTTLGQDESLAPSASPYYLIVTTTTLTLSITSRITSFK